MVQQAIKLLLILQGALHKIKQGEVCGEVNDQSGVLVTWIPKMEFSVNILVKIQSNKDVFFGTQHT